MKAHLYLLVFCLLYNATIAYEIPAASLLLINNGFRISIPDHPGIKKVFYVVEVNNACSPLSDIVNEASDNAWSFSPGVKLQSGDQLSLAIVLQHDDDTIMSSQCLNVGQVDPSKYYMFENCEAASAVVDPQTPDCELATMTEHSLHKISSCLNELIFSDEFDTQVLDSSKWTVEAPLPKDDRSADFEFVMYDKENVQTKDGKLVISPKILSDYVPHQGSSQRLVDAYRRCKVTFRRQCNNVRPVISGRITTKDSGFYFRYGRIEVRAKFPIGDWLYPVIMLEPLNGFKKYDSAQLRVAVANGNRNLTANGAPIDASTLYGGVVVDTGKFYEFMKSRQLNKPLGDDFHTYTLIWERDRIIMQLDGEEYGRVESVFVQPQSKRKFQPFNQQFFLTIGLAAGGFSMYPYNTSPETPWEFSNPKAVDQFFDNCASWNATWTSPNLEVDYVRVYAI